MSIPVGKWVKVVKDGGTFLIEFHADQSVTESAPFSSDSWGGKWEAGTTNDEYGKPGLPGIRLEVGGFTTILTQDADGMSGQEDGRAVRLFRLA